MDWVNAFSVGPCIVSFYAGLSGVPDYSAPAWSGSMAAGDSHDIPYLDTGNIFTIAVSSAGNVALSSNNDVSSTGYGLMVDVQPIAAHTSTRVANVITTWTTSGGGGG